MKSQNESQLIRGPDKSCSAFHMKMLHVLTEFIEAVY